MTVYLHYRLRNTAPLRIADDSTSQRGQKLTRCYIPGSTLRGMIINKLSQNVRFETWKKYLFSNQIRFENSYPLQGECQLYPSLMGFYEDKTEEGENGKVIENVVISGDTKPGHKRASLGQYCRIDENHMIRYCSLETGSDLKILANVHENQKRNIFRNQYIRPGYIFAGTIVMDDNLPDDLKQAVKSALDHQTIYLGNSRTSGYGRCEAEAAEDRKMIWSLPYEQQDMKEECYMVLLSDTAMYSDCGEVCGLNMEELSRQMDVQDLKILYSATGVETVRGFNRAWQVKIPAIPMYIRGSVFHFSYTGVLTKEKAQVLMRDGIGIRCNEGFGRIIFIPKDEYEKIHSKKKTELPLQEEEKAELKPEDMIALKNTARRYYQLCVDEAVNQYVLKNYLKKGAVRRSQLGRIEAIASAYRFDPEMGFRCLQDYLEHAEEKDRKQRVHTGHADRSDLIRAINNIVNTELNELLPLSLKQSDMVMGIKIVDLFEDSPVSYSQYAGRKKLELIIKMIRFDNKEDA